MVMLSRSVGHLPGRELPPRVLRALARASLLVLVGTRGVVGSAAVRQEVTMFLRSRRAFVPVSVDGALEAASWYGEIGGASLSPESTSRLEEGSPSDQVIRRIAASARFTKRTTRLRWAFATGATSLATLMILVIWASHQAWRSAEQALKNEHRANEQTALALKNAANAKTQEAIAVERQQEAIRQQHVAEQRRAEVLREASLPRSGNSRGRRLSRRPPGCGWQGWRMIGDDSGWSVAEHRLDPGLGGERQWARAAIGVRTSQGGEGCGRSRRR
jgi:hypothetical protein